MKSKFWHFLLSLAVAFGLWLYVINVVNPESEEIFYNVPVVLNNETVLNENGLMILSEGAPTVTLKLKGNRSDLNNLKKSDITVMADLSKINEVGEKYLTYSISFPGTNFEVVSQSPQNVTLNVVRRASKEVDVVVRPLGSTPSDFIADIDDAELSHEKITITGPLDVVEQITQAVVEVDIEGKKETIIQSSRYTLCDKDGKPVDAEYVQTNVAEIGMTLRILQVKQLQLLLNLTYGGGATEQNTLIKIDPMTIKVAGSEKLLEGLDSLVLGSVNLAELAENKTLSFPINLPEGIQNITGVEEATVTIEFNGLETKTLKISQITAVGSDGMTVSLTTRVFEVVVRGTPEQIRVLTEKNLRAQIDCTGAEAGDGRFKAQIFIDTTNNAFNTVGVVGTYYVHATVSIGGT